MRRFLLSFRRILLPVVVAIAALYGLAAYLLAPTFWRHYERQHALADKAMVTTTGLGIPGDPLNVGIEGARDDLICAMAAAGWGPADPITLISSLRIASSVALRRPYQAAPVSNLFWDGRREDLAFEKPSGVSPSHRNHVRFWLALAKGDGGAPVFLGAATFDRSVGLSEYTGQITHHIAADVDVARNGGGDPYFTDGEIKIARLRPGCQAHEAPPSNLEPTLKARAFRWLAAVWSAIGA
jgi:hypothetical protein